MFFSLRSRSDSLGGNTELSSACVQTFVHGEFPCFQGHGVYNKGSPLTTTVFCKILQINSRYGSAGVFDQERMAKMRPEMADSGIGMNGLGTKLVGIEGGLPASKRS